jgi:SAM-dependent methyltransferase
MQYKKFLLESIINQTEKIHIIDHTHIMEKDYAGNYADVNNLEELDLIDKLANNPWHDVVRDRFAEKSPWLYQVIVDLGRAAFLDLINIKQGGTYLDVGSGWGQVAIPLSKIGNVVALDLTINRLKILERIALQEESILNYVQGNFLTFPFKSSVFDFIIFNGSLEWIALGRKKEETVREIQVRALRKARDLLKEDGKIYIGIENSLGLKYLLGAPDDHTGIAYFNFLSESQAEEKYISSNKVGRLPAKTWSLGEYKEMICEAGLVIERIYGCFPDYKIIRMMIDLREINQILKKQGLLYPEHQGVDGSNIGFTDEMDALYRRLAENGIAQYFCPSYGFCLKKG